MDKFSANELDGEEIKVNGWVKELSRRLNDFIAESIADSREKEIALERLEECAMWATKAVAFHGTKQN